MKNILCAVDVKSTDDKILNHGKLLAGKFDAKLWIVHVAAPDPHFVGYEAGPTNVRNERADKLKDEHAKLHDYMDTIEKEGLNVEALLIQGPTVETLEKQIDELDADLLVMGSRKKNILQEALFGHTSTMLIKNQKIPVTIVPL